jgi:hypothetical protein
MRLFSATGFHLTVTERSVSLQPAARERIVPPETLVRTARVEPRLAQSPDYSACEERPLVHGCRYGHSPD